MEAMEDRTELNTRLDLWIAFDYGGRAELVEAARRIVESGVDPREIDENVFAANLYAPELPDPDLLIRTSGELRISNFLLWQLAYAELVFVDRLWPDFDARDLRGALAEYAQRRRRDSAAVAMSNWLSRLVVAVVAAADRARRRSTSAAGGCSRSSRSPAAIALHEFWLLARPLAPLAPAGLRRRGARARRRASSAASAWMVGGALTTFALAFLLKAISEARARRRRRRSRRR